MFAVPDAVGCCWPQLGLLLWEIRRWAFVSSPELFVAWAVSCRQLGTGKGGGLGETAALLAPVALLMMVKGDPTL